MLEKIQGGPLRPDPAFAFCQAPFLMTFATGGIPHAGSWQCGEPFSFYSTFVPLSLYVYHLMFPILSPFLFFYLVSPFLSVFSLIFAFFLFWLISNVVILI